MNPARHWLIGVVALLGACAENAGQSPDQAAPQQPTAETAAPSGPLAVPGSTQELRVPNSAAAQVITSASVPHIYMAIQPGGTVPHSVIFAIDRSRDNSPSDDPAIRLSPEEGKCNPQEMRRFAFPENYALRPIFGPEESRRGIGAKEMPNFMAMAVTSEMMRLGLIVEPPESKPQNVCTRKLWEQLILAQSVPAEN